MPGFTSPPDPTFFKNLVWNIVRKIPVGRVATYGQIATLVGPPKGVDPADYRAFGARWVGGAMAGCPPNVPWQRVVNSEGKISLAKGKGAEDQRMLLEEEGIEFDARDRIDLNRYRWDGTISEPY